MTELPRYRHSSEIRSELNGIEATRQAARQVVKNAAAVRQREALAATQGIPKAVAALRKAEEDERAAKSELETLDLAERELRQRLESALKSEAEQAVTERRAAFEAAGDALLVADRGVVDAANALAKALALRQRLAVDVITTASPDKLMPPLRIADLERGRHIVNRLLSAIGDATGLNLLKEETGPLDEIAEIDGRLLGRPVPPRYSTFEARLIQSQSRPTPDPFEVHRDAMKAEAEKSKRGQSWRRDTH